MTELWTDLGPLLCDNGEPLWIGMADHVDMPAHVEHRDARTASMSFGEQRAATAHCYGMQQASTDMPSMKKGSI